MLSFFASKLPPIEPGIPPHAQFEINALGGKILHIPCPPHIRALEMSEVMLRKVLGFNVLFSDITYDRKTRRTSFRATGFLSRYVGYFTARHYAYLNGDLACTIDVVYKAEVY